MTAVGMLALHRRAWQQIFAFPVCLFYCRHSTVMLLKPAFWPHETLHRVGQHEQISLPVRGIVFDDLLRGNGSPLVLDPGIPAILRVFVVAGLDLEFRLDGIGNAAAKP